MGKATGQFVWHDLLTSNLEGAKSFYTAIVGWTASRWKATAGWDEAYEVWRMGGQRAGGLMALPEEARKAGVPPHWLGYVATDDVDATVQRATRQKGKLLTPPEDVPDVGRFAVLADPQGARFAVFKPAQQHGEAPERAPNQPGYFGWAELNTTDWKAAWAFYSELFGWKHARSMDMGPELGEYFMFGTRPETAMGGMSNVATQMKAPAHWLHYINVKSTDEAAKHVPEQGGHVMNGPMDVPGGGRIMQCVDPQGAMFALFS